MHAEWESFFLADVGAAAALAGLIFVAVSINIDQIIAYPSLPGRAWGTIAVLMAALAYGALALIPDQTLRQLGIEVLLLGSALWILLARQRLTARHHHDNVGRGTATRWGHVVLDQLATLPAVIAGVLLVADSSAGLGVLAFGVLATFFVAVTNAWVLLVEVRR